MNKKLIKNDQQFFWIIKAYSFQNDPPPLENDLLLHFFVGSEFVEHF